MCNNILVEKKQQNKTKKNKTKVITFSCQKGLLQTIESSCNRRGVIR